ncbi:uncharacterized protein LOC135399675 isoform X2 [Ornithodoros turicata]|uniref:uncharacterized protein LOC135399675 isoform X2 n=1 Tax=Ornithodoros turicata TaxID=34597 RepID=UPI003139CA28
MLRKYISAERERLYKVRLHLESFEASVETAGAVEPEEYFGLPMNAFLTIKRLAVDYHEIVDLATDDRNANILLGKRTAAHKERRLVLPTREDILRSTAQVINFQRQRAYTSSAIVRIVSNMANNTVTLTARDCKELGDASNTMNDKKAAKEWMEMAQRLSRNDGYIIGMEYMAMLAHKRSRHAQAVSYANKIQYMNPGHARSLLKLERYVQAVEKPYSGCRDPLIYNFGTFVRHNVQSTQKCFWLTYKHASVLPVRIDVEHLQGQPDMFAYNNLLSLKEQWVLWRTLLLHEPGACKERFQTASGLSVVQTQGFWRLIRVNCSEHTVWLNAGHNLERQPLATWWTFLGYSHEFSLTTNLKLSRGASVLRYHVTGQNVRDDALLQFSCRGVWVILVKRVMLEDQPQFLFPWTKWKDAGSRGYQRRCEALPRTPPKGAWTQESCSQRK